MPWWIVIPAAVLGGLAYTAVFFVAGPSSLFNVHDLPPKEVKTGARRAGFVVFLLALGGFFYIF